MNLLIRLTFLSATSLILSCATSDPYNPWQTPNRGFSVSSPAENSQLINSMQPCIEYARSSLDSAISNFQDGLPEGAKFIAVVFNDDKFTRYISVGAIDSTLIHGRIGGRLIIDGRFYADGDKISIGRKKIVDWYIIYRDRPPEGNLLGKYMLLKQDGLATGDCEPSDAEFHRYRYFSMNHSFVPPGTDGWEMRGPWEGSDMSMHNEGKSPDELNTLGSYRQIMPEIDSMQDLIAKTRTHMEYPPEEADRYTVLKHDVKAFTKKDAMCVLSQQVIDDKKALLMSKKRVPMVREVQALICLHPFEKNMGIKLTYSHRYYPGNRDADFIYKAKKVFESLAFRKRN